ncbi:MAG TPA: complex I subunit 1 family protein [Phycisphaeraceae bacterium]
MTAQFIVSVITGLIVVHVILLSCAYLIFLERKVAAWCQDRIGPNRTNFSFGVLPFKGKHWGLGQALADGLKLMLKEDYNPPHVDRVLFFLAPALAVIPAMLGWAVIPWGGMMSVPGFTLPDWLPVLGGTAVDPAVVRVAVAPINVGVIYILAISSLAVYGVVLAGYASNNKYSFLGGLRATAQILSYEIPMGLCVLILILTYSTTDALGISLGQTGSGLEGMWGVFTHPLLAVIFFTCVLAECNRAPFDLAEAEQELVGGFHTEYSSMKWALFFLAEYMHMVTGCAFFCVLFLGGWDLIPFVREMPEVGGIGLVLLKTLIFFGKVAFLLFVMMWVRWTLPRLRFDQLMKLAWRGLIPTVLVVLLAAGVVVFVLGDEPWVRLALLAANVVVGVGAMVVGPMLPQGPPVNRRVPLAGSRFNPPPAEAATPAAG